MEHALAMHLPGVEPGLRLVGVAMEGGAAQQEVEAVLVVAHLWVRRAAGKGGVGGWRLGS